MITEFRHQAMLALQTVSPEQQEAMAQAEKQIAKARSWVASSGIGEAAVQLWDASKPWHVWANREDWADWNVLQVTEVSGGYGSVGETWSAFRRNELDWRFRHVSKIDDWSIYPGLRGELTTSVNGKDILIISTTKDSAEFSQWVWSDVTAIAIGPWTAQLIEMSIILKTERLRRYKDSELRRLQDLADNMKL